MSDGVVDEPFVLTQDFSVNVHKISGNIVAFVKEHGVVATFQKILALLFGGEIFPADFTGQFLDFVLVHLAQGEQHRRKLVFG